MTRLSLKGLAARPLRTALTTLAIVLGVALVTGALTLTDTQRRGADALSSASYDGTDAVVSARTAFSVDADGYTVERPTVDPAVLERVRALPEVAVAAGDVTDLGARMFGPRGEAIGDGPYFGVGLDARRPGVERLTPFRLERGRWATGRGQVVIDAKTADEQGLAIGDRVRIAARGEAQSFAITGIARFGEVRSLGVATVAVFDLEEARRVLGRGDGYDSVLVAAREGTPAEQLRAAVARAAGDRVQVQTAAEHDRFTFEGLGQFISIIRTVLLAFGAIAVLVGALTILNSLSITGAQRSRELGLLRLVGARRSQVLRAVLVEALVIGLLGSLVGLGVGYLIALGLQGLFASLGLDLPQAGTVFATRTVVVALLVGTLVTVLAGLVPALRATRLAPAVALREASDGARRVGIVGRLVRPLVSLLGRPGQAVGGVAGLLARRNATRRPGRTLSTAGALTVGAALVTCVAVIAAGLRDTTRGTLEDRVDATHVVIGSDGFSPTDPDVQRRLDATPGVRATTSVRVDGGLAFGDVERVNAVEPATAGRMLGFDWVQGSQATLAALGADGAVVDQGWAREHGLTVGERFAVTSARGDRLTLQVRGIERSPVLDGLDLGPITVSRAAYDRAFGTERNTLVLVDAAPGTDPTHAVAAFPDAEVLTRAAFVDERLAPIDPLLAIFAVLLALAVLVSLFGIVNALVLATFERRRELGMLRAVGMTRRQVRRMVRHEAVTTALLGAATGIAAGLGLGWVATTALSEEGLAFAIPTGQLVVLAVAAIVCGVLAAVLPARRAARMSPLSALAYE
jgi:putative ABC transport system permease protein